MDRRLLIIVALSALFLGSWSVRGEDSKSKNEVAREKAKAEWRKRMLKRVGKKVTVAGTLEVGKISDFIRTDEDGHVYVHTLRGVDAKLLNDPEGTRFAVTGKLEFSKKVVAPPGISGIPEHFFIRDGEVSVVEDQQDESK